jgi:uncharacterized membrane protein
MAIAAIALTGVFVALYMLLYKLGAFGTILCGTGGCEVVQNSPWAYFLGVPVAAWGLAGYMAMLGAAMAGVQPRFAASRWVAAVLVALTSAALLFSIYLSYLEEFVIGAWCQWCILSAVLSLLGFLLALPEVRRIRRGRVG